LSVRSSGGRLIPPVKVSCTRSSNGRNLKISFSTNSASAAVVKRTSMSARAHCRGARAFTSCDCRIRRRWVSAKESIRLPDRETRSVGTVGCSASPENYRVVWCDNRVLHRRGTGDLLLAHVCSTPVVRSQWSVVLRVWRYNGLHTTDYGQI